MHSADDKPADDFWLSIDRQLADGDLDFRGFVFPGPSVFYETGFVGDADFRRATFLGDADFSGAKFSGSASFGSVTFSGDALFRLATFSKGAWFHAASFAGRAHFGAVTFSDTAHFGAVTFTGAASFGATFAGTAYFDQSTFSGDAWFRRAEFSDDADFHGATFARTADFRNVTFSGLGAADFGRARFADGTLLADVEFGKPTDFGYADLEHAYFRSVDLAGCHFRESRGLDKAEFDDVRWGWWPPQPATGLRGLVFRRRLAVADEVWARGGPGLPRGPAPSFESVERVYRGLRASYEARKDHPRVGSFYFAEMEMRRLSHGRFGRTIGSLTAWYGLVSGYGERWLRTLGWFVGVWLLSADLYFNAGLLVKVTRLGPGNVSQATLEPARLIPDALIHSLLVATLIGRDIYAVPETWVGHLVQAGEIILGPLLLGLMGLGIRRRFQR